MKQTFGFGTTGAFGFFARLFLAGAGAAGSSDFAGAGVGAGFGVAWVPVAGTIGAPLASTFGFLVLFL